MNECYIFVSYYHLRAICSCLVADLIELVLVSSVIVAFLKNKLTKMYLIYNKVCVYTVHIHMYIHKPHY